MKLKNLQIDYEKLKKTISLSKILKDFDFIFDEAHFNVFYVFREKDDEDSIVFWLSRAPGEYEIYLSKNVIPRDLRKPVIFHEVLEAIVFNRLPNNLDGDECYKKAHVIASAYDLVYARETLTESSFEKFEKLKIKWQK